jgi:hypothetical protein
MWTIVEEHRFISELAALRPDPVRADEFVEGAKMVLARKPQSGEQISQDVWMIPMAKEEETAIFYRFDEETVYLISIRIGLSEE